MRIVITGASGNVGTATLLALGAEGRHQLVGVSRRTPSRVPPYSWAEWAPIDTADLDAAQRLQLTEPGWLDMAANVPRLDTTRLRSLGWSPTRDSREVLGRFVDAISRSAGRPGPLLHRPATRQHGGADRT
jgi:nucleoside-diphosphate-sugar epimerase